MPIRLRANRATAAAAAAHLTSAAAHPAGAPCSRCRPTAAGGRRQGWRARTGSARLEIRRTDGAWGSSACPGKEAKEGNELQPMHAQPAWMPHLPAIASCPHCNDRSAPALGPRCVACPPCPSSCALAGRWRGLSCGGPERTAACRARNACGAVGVQGGQSQRGPRIGKARENAADGFAQTSPARPAALPTHRPTRNCRQPRWHSLRGCKEGARVV